MKTQRSTQLHRQSSDSASLDQTSDRKAGLRGMSYDEQVAALTPKAVNDKGAQKDPNEEVGPNDTPGLLYSNTSKTNLNKKSKWHERLGFSLGQAYEASVTFDDLVRAGRALKAPTGTNTGPVQVPRGAKSRDAMEYDYVRTDTGAIEESGPALNFALRGGAGGVGGPVKLRFANNGGLNLARLARSAYELVIAKGVTFAGDVIDYKGQTFALGCTVQMGNEIDADESRAYGFVGEFELKWMQEKVSNTLEALVSAYAVAGRDAMTGDPAGKGDAKKMHPDFRSAHLYQTKYQVENAQGVRGTRPNSTPIQSNRFRDATVRAWGSGKEQRAWLKDVGEITAVAQRGIDRVWAPGGDWFGHPTYITACPDFTAELQALFTTAQGAKDEPAKEIEAVMLVIGSAMQTADMNHDLITDSALQARVLAANRAMIKKAFGECGQTKIEERLDEIDKAQSTPHLKGFDEPVKDVEQSNEGLIGLRKYNH